MSFVAIIENNKESIFVFVIFGDCTSVILSFAAAKPNLDA